MQKETREDHTEANPEQKQINPLLYEEELNVHKAKTGISKYDLIKVKILSGTGESYSILSRLIIYRMLTCIGVA